MADVTPIRPGAYDPDRVGTDEVIDPDKILEAHKGQCQRMAFVFIDHYGELKVAGSHGAPDSHMLLGMGMAELCKLAQT